MTEVDYDEIERLQERVNSYELMSALTPAEFDEYFAAESDLENRIAAFADLCAGYLNFSTASDAFDEIIELNRRLREICGRELDRTEPPPAEEYRDRLRGAQIEAHALTLLAEGVKRTFQAEDRRLRGDLNSTLAYLEGAREYFIELANGPSAQAHQGVLRNAITDANIAFHRATSNLRQGHLTSALEGFQLAQTLCEKYFQLYSEAEALDLPAIGAYAAMNRNSIEMAKYSAAMQAEAEFQREAQDGNFGEAVDYGREVVRLLKELLESSEAANDPEAHRNIREMELAHMRGWLHWAEAEDAIGRQDWDACVKSIREARTEWKHATALSLAGESIAEIGVRPLLGSTEMSVRSTQRRLERERAHHAEVARLQTDISRMSRFVFNVQGGSAMAGDQFNLQNANVNQVGSHNVSHGTSITAQQNITTAAAVDLVGLAKELVSLREAMTAGARTPEQQESVAAVEAAEQAAQNGDEGGVRRNLAKAGRWALTIAEKLALTAAETAIRAGIGV
ncbi:hypothetical protein [Nonomuraea sp. B19D2]|uniref:hypothetical protein n=1 Tax=Nonomuraea sp. B19D2 TaxID=3159561 RepID=UPI0032DAB411